MIPPGGHGSPFAPFQRTRRSPCFTHTQGRRFPSNCETCSGKPHKKFSYARNVSYYKLVIHHSRGDGTGTLDTVCCKYAYGYGALANIVPEALSVAFERSYGRDGLGRGCVANRRNPRSAETFFGTVPFLWRRTRALHRSGTGTLYPEHGSGIKVISWKYQLFATFLKPTKNCRHV